MSHRRAVDASKTCIYQRNANVLSADDNVPSLEAWLALRPPIAPRFAPPALIALCTTLAYGQQRKTQMIDSPHARSFFGREQLKLVGSYQKTFQTQSFRFTRRLCELDTRRSDTRFTYPPGPTTARNSTITISRKGYDELSSPWTHRQTASWFAEQRPRKFDRNGRNRPSNRSTTWASATRVPV
jgi:hypothetical protein